MAFYRCAGGTDPTGNAGVGDVLEGKTFSNADGIDKTGTMPRKAIGTNATYTGRNEIGPFVYFPYGYYPEQNNTKMSLVYLSDAQAVDCANKQEKTVTSSRSAQTVTPDSGKVLSKVTVNALAPTGTYKPTARANNNDMGATGNYRYVDTTAVPNSNSGTYTYAANSTGGTVDMGATNTYRYVNASNVYAKGKADVVPFIDATSSFNNGTSHVYSYSEIYAIYIVYGRDHHAIDGSYFYIWVNYGGISYIHHSANAYGDKIEFSNNTSNKRMTITNHDPGGYNSGDIKIMIFGKDVTKVS